MWAAVWLCCVALRKKEYYLYVGVVRLGFQEKGVLFIGPGVGSAGLAAGCRDQVRRLVAAVMYRVSGVPQVARSQEPRADLRPGRVPGPCFGGAGGMGPRVWGGRLQEVSV